MKFGGKGKSLEEQLVEQKEKEKKILKLIEEEKKVKQKQQELEEQLAKEKKILEDKKAHEAHMKKELEKVKEQEKQQQEHARIEAKKEQVKDHPVDCFCERCLEIRKDTSTNNIKEKLIEEKTRESEIKKTTEESKPTESKKSRFKFKLPKREPKPEILKKEDLNEYHKVKKDPTKLVGFIKNQKEKIHKHAETEKAINTIKKEGAIDTKIQPSIFTDLTVLGIRLAIGFSFIAHGLSKMHEDMVGFLPMLELWGVPTELGLPIALAELIAGILITTGILSRISSVIIGIIMLGAIFVVKGTGTLIGQGGIELDVIIIACVALLGIFGPGRFSVANIGIKGMIFDRKLQ